VAEIVYPPVIAALRTAFVGLNITVDVHGAQHIPRSGGAVLASNHVSYLDFIFVGFAARPSRRLVRFMAKDAVFKHRISGPLMRGMHHIPVDRDAGAGSYAQALRMLRDGEVVGVFPEATMSRSFDPKEFKTGAVRLARATKTPLVPVGVWGTQRLWCYDERSTMKQRGVPVTVCVGEPVDATGDPDLATARLRAAVTELVEQARERYPSDGTGQWWQPERLGGTAPAVVDSDASG
jgi:1-acyl-sn-glycerol-3-phosphate acyltransferase